MTETLYRVEVLCQGCGEEYLSRAKEEADSPDRCKECKSAKTLLNPEKDPKVFEVQK